MMDRGGLTAADGPTHHGTFDFGYMRIFPNITVMAPGDANDIGAMLDFSLSLDGPSSMRYPKDTATEITRELQPVEMGKAEVLSWGTDGNIFCAGTPLANCIEAVNQLREEGLDVGVVNARFIKPIDEDVVRRALTENGFVVTVEEAMLMGGYGSAVLEAANNMRLDASRVHRIGIPDKFMEHASRDELFEMLRLDAKGIAQTCREAAKNTKPASAAASQTVK